MDENSELITSDFDDKIQKSISHLADQFRTIRTGRAAPALIDSIRVEAYGVNTPMNQLAHISVPEPRQLLVKPFDMSLLGEIEKAILRSDIGLTPNSDGKLLRLSLPALSEEQRKKLCVRVKDLAEAGRVALRNSRRDANKHADQAKKDHEMSEDLNHDLHDKIQELLKAGEAKIDDLLAKKTKEIMTD